MIGRSGVMQGMPHRVALLLLTASSGGCAHHEPTTARTFVFEQEAAMRDIILRVGRPDENMA